jgi:hypothetical protein
MRHSTIWVAALALVVGVATGALTRTRESQSPRASLKRAAASLPSAVADSASDTVAQEAREAGFLKNRSSSERLKELNRSSSERLLALLRSGQDDEAFDLVCQWDSGSAELSPGDLAALMEACRGGHSAKLRQRLLFLLFECAKESMGELVADLAVRETDVMVRRSAIQVAAYLGGPEMRLALETGVRDAHPVIRADALSALVVMERKDPAVADLAYQMMRAETDVQAREQMVLAVGAIKESGTEPLLWSVLEDPTEAPAVAIEALRALPALDSWNDDDELKARLERVLQATTARGAPEILVKAIQNKLAGRPVGYPGDDK